jgi:hypothetical protein
MTPMTPKTFFCAAAAALLSLATLAQAQTAQPGNTAKPSAYGSANQGVSQPSGEPILANGYTDASVPANTNAVPAAPAPQNPDAGIVEAPVPDDAPVAASNRTAMRSPSNPDGDIVTVVEESPNELPQGTPLHARLVEEISADTVSPGAPFTARLTMDVIHMGAVVVPAGSYIHGRVAYVNVGRRIGGLSSMKLRAEEIVLPDGNHYSFRGIVTQTFGSGTRATSEGEIVNTSHPLKTTAEYGAAAGGGAIAGAVVGGPVGAGVGAGIGAGLMTVHWLRARNAPVLPAGSGITFALSTPINLTVAPAATPQASMVPPQAAVQTSTPPPVSTYVEPKVQN